ncbi:DUF6223 family protein [Dactylosporangium sp. CS-033363]|uniref:DUF6223 family protein n=1 Tax=Dactylosporangium sp. CS-033363 TaxID=3239935 RepID=UPI003D8B8AE4
MLTLDRIVATVAALLALAGLIAGSLALAGRLGRYRKAGPAAAVGAGAAGLLVGAWVVLTADGGSGTGNGVVGGFAALAFGLAAIICGALARNRQRAAA